MVFVQVDVPSVPVSYQNLVITATAFFTAALVAWNTYQGKRRDAKLEVIQKTGEANHVLSNSAMGAKLTDGVEDASIQLVQAKTIADLRKSPADLANVTAAELKVEQRKKLLADHLVKQAVVDAAAGAVMSTSAQA